MNNQPISIYQAIHEVWNIIQYSSQLTSCYLLNWAPDYYKSQCFPDDSFLTHRGIKYEIIRINKIDDRCKKVALSFRSYRKTNIVLVKGIY